MFQIPPLLRAVALALALHAPLAAQAAPPKLDRNAPGTASLATRSLDPACWSTFLECLSYLEKWAGRDLPDWVVHSVAIQYSARKPLYEPDGSPRLDAGSNPVCALVPESGRVFFPPAWRLRGRTRLPLVVYPHATMLEKVQVPSEFGGHEWMLGAAAAAYYGFAVAMPDQPGMGGDTQAYHPFCHAKSLGYAILDALPAVARLVREDPYLAQRHYDWDGRVYFMGYSEGGYTALAAVKEWETHPDQDRAGFSLAGSACMAGPFDLAGVTRQVIIDPQLPFAHCFYLPFVIMAYQAIYGNALVDPLQALAPDLLENREDGNILQWVDGCMDGLEVDVRVGRRLHFPADAVVQRRMLNPDWLAAQLDDPAYATSPIRRLLEENSLCGGFRPTHPILFCQSPADRDVPLTNTLEAMAGLAAEIRRDGGDPGRMLAFLPIGKPEDGITHVEGALIAIPAAFNWIYSGAPIATP